MNQILYTIENEEEKNRMKSIVLFFAITIIIFGLIMISMGAYRIVSAKNAREEALEAAKIPNINMEIQENIVKLNINHIRPIKEIVYSWNNEEETVLSVNSENFNGNVTEEIEVLGGTNTLNVKVVDEKGKTATMSKEITYKGTYMDLSVVDNKSLKIVVTDMVGLQSVTYQWNSEEEITAYPEQNNLESLEILTDIPNGLNTIKIKAVNRENAIENKEMPIQGITKPTVKIDYNTERTILTIKLDDTQGIQSYSYSLSSAPIRDIAENGNIRQDFKDKLTLVVSESKQGEGQTSITEQVPFQTGFNYLEVTITNTEGVEENFSGWCAK